MPGTRVESEKKPSSRKRFSVSLPFSSERQQQPFKYAQKNSRRISLPRIWTSRRKEMNCSNDTVRETPSDPEKVRFLSALDLLQVLETSQNKEELGLITKELLTAVDQMAHPGEKSQENRNISHEKSSCESAFIGNQREYFDTEETIKMDIIPETQVELTTTTTSSAVQQDHMEETAKESSSCNMDEEVSAIALQLISQVTVNNQSEHGITQQLLEDDNAHSAEFQSDLRCIPELEDDDNGYSNSDESKGECSVDGKQEDFNNDKVAFELGPENEEAEIKPCSENYMKDVLEQRVEFQPCTSYRRKPHLNSKMTQTKLGTVKKRVTSPSSSTVESARLCLAHQRAKSPNSLSFTSSTAIQTLLNSSEHL